MDRQKPYFFCGIGGSGMLPLALILSAKGIEVSGSDRALDQGRTPEKFEFLRAKGIRLFPQDGSGVTRPDLVVVTSTAVEATVPDVEAARRIGAQLMIRAELLADLFNAAALAIGVAGTSGKSTTTGMIGWILHVTGRDPTVMNGAVMTNFVTPDVPFASALVGNGDIFVSEVDESDGSIARYSPRVAVLNNISLDHKSLDELRKLFRDFVKKAQTSVLNLDNDETAALAREFEAENIVTYSLADPRVTLFAGNVTPAPDGISFDVGEWQTGKRVRASLLIPGEHNVSNALAAIGAAQAAGVALEDAVDALTEFKGVRRRLETVGKAGGVVVIDDFAHNPDKIAATLSTLHDFPGRLLVMFQPHGFNPLRLMKNEFVACFSDSLAKDDVLVMPEPVYFGGTVERSISSADIVRDIVSHGRQAFAFADRPACGAKLLELARAGDRIVIMGARDDTLTEFARGLVAGLGERSKAGKAQ